MKTVLVLATFLFSLNAFSFDPLAGMVFGPFPEPGAFSSSEVEMPSVALMQEAARAAVSQCGGGANLWGERVIPHFIEADGTLLVAGTSGYSAMVTFDGDTYLIDCQ
jgi:hypothetical protein